MKESYRTKYFFNGQREDIPTTKHENKIVNYALSIIIGIVVGVLFFMFAPI